MARLLYLFFLLICLDASGQVDYRQVIAQGLRFQTQADSLQRLVETQTASLISTPESGRIRIMLAISDNFSRAEDLQKLADQRFAEAASFERTMLNNSMSLSGTTGDNWHETANIRESQFAILPQSPYSASNPFPIDEPLPDGVVYKIQLGAFSRTPSANAFRGLTPISGESLDNGITKYFAGLFWKYSDADNALRQVREYGFSDAFLVSFYYRISISIERARQLENSY